MKLKLLNIAIVLLLNIPIFGQFKYDQKKVDQISWTPRSEFVIGLDSSTVQCLDGKWDFFYKNTSDPLSYSSIKSDTEISVPGEWVMQGYNLAKDSSAIYRLVFDSYFKGFKGKIHLQFEAVYSFCEVYLNGSKLGEHHTGFTPFEFEVSSLVKDFGNVLILKVKSDGSADMLSSASAYAMHSLGGISRSVYLQASPSTYLRSSHVSTIFDREYKDAQLLVSNNIISDLKTKNKLELEYQLFDSEYNLVSSNKFDQGANRGKFVNRINVANPIQWNPERPYLYTLKIKSFVDGKLVQILSKKVGFRQIQVRGNKVYVNNMPIKLRGVNRHEVHPISGRTLSDDQWYRDVMLFKQANVNYIRTSHYPPSEKLIEACDQLGVFVECEAPFCWASKSHVNDDNYFDQILRPSLEMVEQLKSHPSIIIWSLANESYDYNELFAESAKLVKNADSTRLRNFSQYGPEADNGELEIANQHYPGVQGPAKYANHNRPLVFDEYLHLNAYNRRELATDPGIRDFWGELLDKMWSEMYKSQAILGGAIWAGIDDTFVMDNGKAVGYGTWGPLDGWRREKPEYYHMKKVYSPVKFRMIEYANDTLSLEFENQYFFQALDGVKILYRVGDSIDNLELKTPPGQKERVKIFVSSKNSEVTFEIWDSYSNYLVDSQIFSLGQSFKSNRQDKSENYRIKKQNDQLRIRGKSIEFLIDSEQGSFFVYKDGQRVISSLPVFSIVPQDDESGGTQMTFETPNFETYSPNELNRQIIQISAQEIGDTYQIVVNEKYEHSIGKQVWTLLPDGIVDVEYEYKVLKDVNPRQYGLKFQFNKGFNTIEWNRIGYWNSYPNNHIGRINGKAELVNQNEICGLAGPLSKPANDYNTDQTANGSNDARSTKRNLISYSYNSQSSSFEMLGQGINSARVWSERDFNYLMLISYDNPGAERFLRRFADHSSAYDRVIRKNDFVRGKFKLRLKRLVNN